MNVVSAARFSHFNPQKFFGYPKSLPITSLTVWDPEAVVIDISSLFVAQIFGLFRVCLISACNMDNSFLSSSLSSNTLTNADNTSQHILLPLFSNLFPRGAIQQAYDLPTKLLLADFVFCIFHRITFFFFNFQPADHLPTYKPESPISIGKSRYRLSAVGNNTKISVA